MDNNNTHEYVEKLNEQQEKEQKNKERQGKGHPDQQLPNHRH